MKKITFFLLVSIVNIAIANDCVRDDAKGVVACKDTNLMWIDNEKVVQKKWNKNNEQAVQYCSNLNYNGFNDWRLPNMNELLSIVDYGRWKPAINSSFQTIPSETRFFSSTMSNSVKNKGKMVFYIEFENGTNSRINSEYGNSLSVRCVRDM